MKVRVTLMTENDCPVSNIGPNAEEKARRAWEALCAMINLAGGPNKDKVTLESVEIVSENVVAHKRNVQSFCTTGRGYKSRAHKNLTPNEVKHALELGATQLVKDMIDMGAFSFKVIPVRTIDAYTEEIEVKVGIDVVMPEKEAAEQ